MTDFNDCFPSLSAQADTKRKNKNSTTPDYVPVKSNGVPPEISLPLSTKEHSEKFIETKTNVTRVRKPPIQSRKQSNKF